MRSAIGVLLLFSVNTLPAAEPIGTKDDQPLVKRWFSKAAVVRAGAGVAWGQMRNSPHEWGRTLGGLGKRSASLVGGHIISSTVSFGVAAAHHEDLRYYPSEESGFGPRLRHALVSTVVARRTNGPGNTPAYGRISGAMSAGLISRLWHPARLRTVANGFETGGISLGVDAGIHVAREFWPEIRHPRDKEKRNR